MPKAEKDRKKIQKDLEKELGADYTLIFPVDKGVVINGMAYGANAPLQFPFTITAPSPGFYTNKLFTCHNTNAEDCNLTLSLLTVSLSPTNPNIRDSLRLTVFADKVNHYSKLWQDFLDEIDTLPLLNLPPGGSVDMGFLIEALPSMPANTSALTFTLKVTLETVFQAIPKNV